MLACSISFVQAQVIRPLSYTTIQKLTIDTLWASHVISTTAAIGTVTSSTWNGTVIIGQYGGTGVANTGKTITLGGNLTTAGAFATILRSTAGTDITLPTTGTLSTLAGAEALTNKTSVNKIKLTAPANSSEFAPSDYTKFILTGGDTVTLTTSANSNVTLPTTGTLSAIGGAETITGVKKFTGHNLYAGEILTATDTLALAVATHYTVLADATASAILLTLPAATTCEGAIIRVKCINAAGAVKIVTAGGTIDATAGATGITLAVWDGREFMSNGTNWYIISKF